MNALTTAVSAALLLPACAVAQNATAQNLDLSFQNLAAQAQKKSEVDLDKANLTKATDAASGVEGIHVRHYEFAAAGSYRISDLDPLRKQVAANPAWSRIVNVQEKDESTEIYVLKTDGLLPGGLLVIAAEAKEVNVVELLGTVDLGRMQEIVKSSISYDLKATANAPK